MLFSKQLILTKNSFKKNETRNRVITDQDHRVNDIGKHIPQVIRKTLFYLWSDHKSFKK